MIKKNQYSYTKRQKDKTTFEFDIAVKKELIASENEKNINEAIGEVTVEGFRKGKAPRKLAEKYLKRDKLYEKAISGLLSEIYELIVSEEKIRPVTQPQIKLEKAKEGEDLQVTMKIAERPQITVGDIKKIVLEVKSEIKKDDIWVPGKPVEEKDTKKDEEKRQLLLNKILESILKASTIEISDIIIQDEVNRRLSQLIDDVRQAGMGIDDYVRSKNTTVETLRGQFAKEIRDMYIMEFALEKIADDHKITVENSDLEKVFSSIDDPKKKKDAQANAYYYASVLKKQKTLDFLLSL